MEANNPTESEDIQKCHRELADPERIPSQNHASISQDEATHDCNLQQLQQNDIIVTELSDLESISEHISKQEFSLSTSENAVKFIDLKPETISNHNLSQSDIEETKSSINVYKRGLKSSNEEYSLNPSYHSTSLDVEPPLIKDVREDPPRNTEEHNMDTLKPQPENSDPQCLKETSISLIHEISATEAHNISNESPVNLPMSSEISKVAKQNDESTNSRNRISPNNDYVDSVNSSLNTENISLNASIDEPSLSHSEEIIKLDIRGTCAPRITFPVEKIFFHPEGSQLSQPHEANRPIFPSMFPTLFDGTGDITEEDVLQTPEKNAKELYYSTPKSDLHSFDHSVEGSKCEENDLLVEEIIIEDEVVNKDPKIELKMDEIPVELKEEFSFSTMATDYKTLCYDYHEKLSHLEAAVTEREEKINKLTTSLQQSIIEKEELRQNLQLISEQSIEQNTIQGHLSDLMKYESMVNDDTKFYSVLSSGSSVKSSNGEKDMDHEEITVNHSRSDLKSPISSDEFHTGLETKLSETLKQYDEFIDENICNQLKERLLLMFNDEIDKVKQETNTDLKQFESQLLVDRDAFSVETRKLRELLASVKTGNADLEQFRHQLNVKHKIEMEELRTYFEKQCTEMEISYRGVCEASARARGEGGGAGDAPALRHESQATETQQIILKFETEIERLKSEHLAYTAELNKCHHEAIVALEDEIKQLKAHIQTAENTEVSVPAYLQDIDLELEKTNMEEVRQQVRQEVSEQLQDKIRVLLSDPDAELSSWPSELVALRDKLHGDVVKDWTSLREEGSASDTDRWRLRRNISFDQSRHLEEVTKERDSLKRATVVLQGVVTQLVRHCAAAEDEINRTVLGELLDRLANLSTLDEEWRACSPPAPAPAEALDASSVSVSSRRVHFAPELPAGLALLDEDCLFAFLQEQRDLSVEIKRELEMSMQRLRNEAQEIYDLSCRLGKNRATDVKALEASVKITELVEELDSRQHLCDNCEIVKKNMEEAMSECIEREVLLREQLEDAMMKIASLMPEHHSDLIAEGVGCGSGPPGPRPAPPPPALDLSSPRSDVVALTLHLDDLVHERDDLKQQLEAANRQLRIDRQFISEQAGEREEERAEFAEQIQRALSERDGARSQLAELHRARSEMRLEKCNNAQKIARQVEQLELQLTEMKDKNNQLESTKCSLEQKLRETNEKIGLLSEIVANLESQLEQKCDNEMAITKELEEMKSTIDDRDAKMRSLLSELEKLRNEKYEDSLAVCLKCSQEAEAAENFEEIIKEQARWLEERLVRRTYQLERVHEMSSLSHSEHTEEMSIRDQKNVQCGGMTPPARSPRAGAGAGAASLGGVCGALEAHERAVSAALKYVADLTATAQEVRRERDVVQARMVAQALDVSTLRARLERARAHADTHARTHAARLAVSLHDARGEVQRLKEELETKDKQLTRLKQTLEDKLVGKNEKLYGNSCNPQDKVLILERELLVAQSRLAQLEDERDGLRAAVRLRDQQLTDVMALNLDEENNKTEEKSDYIDGAKISARTLSDIVSISEYDDQDLQMRRAELKQNMTTPFTVEFGHNQSHNKTLPPDVQRHNMSLNLECTDNLDLVHDTPKADSLPIHLTSTQQRDCNKNISSIYGTIEKFGDGVKHSTAQKIHDNCSMFPNRDAIDSIEASLEPKKINFSLEPSKGVDEDFTSLREMGIALDIKQENFPDILSQLKNEIKKSRSELFNCKSELKNAEDQLCEFPALKEEVEELKSMLENALSTMDTDKAFYETQLEKFKTNKQQLEEKLAELAREVSDKSKDLYIIKEDLQRRENMILELAKEKRNLTNKMADLQMKTDELESRNATLEKYETENLQLNEKVSELKKLEQLVSEKNQQIDSLNQHLDRLDDLQRRLIDKNYELDQLKECHDAKTNEIYHLQETVTALNKDLANTHEENNKLNILNKELKIKLTKLEKDQENHFLKQQSNEMELQRLETLNNELTSKIDELKQLSITLKDKETEIEILNEDINSYHEEIASLKEQLKMVSRSPSPRKNSLEDKPKSADRQASNDKKQLVKIRKQISLLQHELDFNKKELNDKAFELAKAKLDLTELTTQLSEATKQFTEQQLFNKQLATQNNQITQQLEQLNNEKQVLSEKLAHVVNRLREESNVGELKDKLRSKIDECSALEQELHVMKNVLESAPLPAESESRALVRSVARSRSRSCSRSRSPTSELERRVREQLNYSERLDDDLMDQILSASSDNEEVPRLALNTSKSSSSLQWSWSERAARLRSDNDKLTVDVRNLEARLRDKDALIAELNRIRDKLVSELQTVQLKRDSERDNCSRLQLMLTTHKETSNAVQKQDASMIEMLKRRLESAMRAEGEQNREIQELKAKLNDVQQSEIEDRLKGEVSLLRSKLEVSRGRHLELQSLLDQSKLTFQRDLDDKALQCDALTNEIHTLRRLKHEAGVELIRAKELLEIQADTIAELERQNSAFKHNAYGNTMMDMEGKSELARELSSLKRCISESQNNQHSLLYQQLLQDKQNLQDKVDKLERELQSNTPVHMEDKDQAIRYLHHRCLRLESYRKALVWQKRYLQSVEAGYRQADRRWSGHSLAPPRPTTNRFKCVAVGVAACVRLVFLVRRRAALRALADAALARPSAAPTTTTDRPPSPRRGTRMHVNTNVSELIARSPVFSTPLRSREEPFRLNTSRTDSTSTSYLNKLDLVSRCLNQIDHNKLS